VAEEPRFFHSSMPTLSRIRLVAVTTALFVSFSLPTKAQQDDSDKPLGDLARSLRKKPSAQEVIDNDNLPQVMDQAESRRLAPSSLRYSIDGPGKNFQVSSPDVTCSLSFSANAKALLSSQYAQLDLPANALLKLDGPATIDGDSLQVSIFNGTDWHVSELAVALTLVKRAEASSADSYFGSAKLVTAVAGAAREPEEPEDRLEKRSDATFLYRMRAAAPPSSTTAFRAPLNVEIGPDQEWHWAIVQARGYPPQPSNGQTAQPLPQHAQALPSEIPQQAPAPPQPNAHAAVH
jgi:hypothetical protein